MRKKDGSLFKRFEQIKINLSQHYVDNFPLHLIPTVTKLNSERNEETAYKEVTLAKPYNLGKTPLTIIRTNINASLHSPCKYDN